MAGDGNWNSRIINDTEKPIVGAIGRPKYGRVRPRRQSVTGTTEVETIFAFASQKTKRVFGRRPFAGFRASDTNSRTVQNRSEEGL